MLTLLLTRHGETDKSHPEQYLGQRVPASLTEVGRDAARSLGARLADVAIDRVVSSPLPRAMETARLIRPGASVVADARLAEADYGAWEGHTVEEIDAGWPELRRAWEEDPATHATPGGESGEDVARRVEALLGDLVAEAAATAAPATVLAVGHSTVNRVLLCVALGVPLRDYRRRFEQSWTRLTVLRFASRKAGDAKLLLGNNVADASGLRGVTWGM